MEMISCKPNSPKKLLAFFSLCVCDLSSLRCLCLHTSHLRAGKKLDGIFQKCLLCTVDWALYVLSRLACKRKQEKQSQKRLRLKLSRNTVVSKE